MVLNWLYFSGEGNIIKNGSIIGFNKVLRGIKPNDKITLINNSSSTVAVSHA